jgi:cell division protein FtsB/ribosomal protein S24E
MADDQVKYSDLIADDVVKGFELLNQVMKDLQSTMASLKTEATNVGSVIKGMGSANRDQQQEIARLAAEVERLKKQMKGLSDEEKKVTEIKRQYKKLTDDQIARVDKLASALGGLRTADEAQRKHALARINLINVENMSYNELQATYNALKDSLNAMTIAERQNTEAGKAMTAQSAKIYDTMNELQKATGKYTLQVGKYRAAFDGLGYSFQQILREAPSALNLNQFFLAISNNIPMFLDQLKSFQNEQKEIKANLAQMTEGTKEYSEQLGKVMSVGQKLGKTLMSWQTLVLVGLLIIRNWEKIVNLFQKLFKKVEDNLASLRKMRQVVNEIDASVESSISKIVVELGELVNRLDSVTQGSVEWKNITERINEIMGDNYDLTGKMPGQIKQITAAYIAQAEQLAKNQFVIQKISENADKAFKRQRAIETILQGGDVKSAAKIFGYEEDSDEYKALERAANTPMPLPSQTDANEKIWEVVDGKPRRVGYDKWMTDQLNRTFDELDGELFTSQDLQKLWDKYYKAMPEGKGGDGNSKPSEQKVTQRYWEAQEATLRAQYEGYALERALAKMNHDKALAEQKAWYTEQQNNLEENIKNGYITREEAGKVSAELDRQNTDIEKGIERQYWEDLRALRMKNLADRKKEWKANADEIEKTEKENAKTRLKGMVDDWQKRRAELVKEGASRREIVEAEVAAEIARLNVVLKLNRDVNGEKMSDEQRQKVEEWIRLLERLQQTGNYGDYKPGQFMGKGGANVTNERKNYANIWEVLGIDMDSNQTSALNSVFDQAKEALNSWMDARKAAADQAKELADDEVSAAENALNREIELRNQGYANNVALRERELADAKEKQRMAMEEQKKIAQEQILLDAALQTSSLITATANIIKQFPNPLVWGPMLATMWGSFAFAKIKAYQASTKSIQFREGGVMMLEGGSHESGHDVNLGIGPDGSNLRAEGGEYFAVINKRNSRKYGSEIPAVVNALNSGMFEDRYIKTSDAVGLLPRIIRADDGSTVDLSAVESGVGQLVKQGESKWTVEGEYRVERYKNRVRRVKIS